MKKVLLLAALAAVSSAMMMAQTDPYVVNLDEAVWNFDDYSDTKPVLEGTTDFVCPKMWVVGNAGSGKSSQAYLPFIYPSKLDKDNSYGYDGRLCERIYGIVGDRRVPVYAILPAIKDKDYANLLLSFYGKGEEFTTSRVNNAKLRIGYIATIADTSELKEHFAEKVINFRDLTLSLAQYDKYEISLSGIPVGAHLVFYDDDVTVINSCLLDNISFTEVGGGVGTSLPLTNGQQNETVKQLRNGKLCILRNGRLYNALGQEIR